MVARRWSTNSPLTVTHFAEWYIIFFIVIAIGTAVSMKHRLIVTKLEPFAKKIRLWPGGWVSNMRRIVRGVIVADFNFFVPQLIPVALLVIVSFPPLIGMSGSCQQPPDAF